MNEYYERYRIKNLNNIAGLPEWLIGKEVHVLDYIKQGIQDFNVISVSLKNNFDKNLLSIYTGLDGTFLLLFYNLEAI